MKKSILTAVLTAFMVSLFLGSASDGTAVAKKSETRKYVDCFRVCKVKGRKAYLEAQNGNVFVYKMKKRNMEEGVHINELYAVRMDSKDTKCVYDDEILEVRYAGFLFEEEYNEYGWVKD